MSIKRTRQKSYSPKRQDEKTVSLGSKAAEPEKSWEAYVAGQADDAFVPYSMKSRYERGALVAHPKFGKGVVTHVDDSRIDVLFADGKKKLGHGL